MERVIPALLLCWLITNPLTGQFSDDFSDGNLDGWQGETTNFIVNTGFQLQLTAPSGSTGSWIHTPVTYIDSMSWELYFKMDFAPSTSNQLKIYLGLTSADPSTASGYYLEIGASGDQDPIEFKFLENGTPQSIGSSAPGIAGSEPVEFKLRITKNSQGNWSCYNLNETIPALLFSASHDVIQLSTLNTFGFDCKYTDTRRDKFFFDDILIQPVMPDILAPTWSSLTVIDSNTLELAFDEPLAANTVLTLNNYVLSPGNLNPQTVEQNQTITLEWASAFVSQQLYTLTISGLQDLAGNVMTTDQKTFTYIQIDEAIPFDILVTEIMADPTPVIGLTDAEYLEIHNASGKIFNLADYTLQVGSSSRDLPDELIDVGDYIILCDEEDGNRFTSFGQVVGISNFPALPNTGTSISIKNSTDEIIHEVIYTDDWYRDPVKADGGWSLEMINPFHRCSESDNWIAAGGLIGGTPGTVNTNWSTSPDTEGPEFVTLLNSGNQSISLRFNETLDAILMENPNLYTITPVLNIDNVIVSGSNFVELQFSTPMEEGVQYQLLPFEAYDCLANSKVTNDTIVFGLVIAPEVGDLLINEILFNPHSGGSRFVEIINASEKFISLETIAIARLTSSQQDIYVTGISEIIGPGEIAAFSPEPNDIQTRYTVPHPDKLYSSTLPSWDDATDNVSILSAGVVLDSFTYSKDWHHPVISDQNGVSLERVSIESPSATSSTWHSAASVAGYATPTGPNSQQLTTGYSLESPFTVTNKQFSPNEDGYKDFLALNFQLTDGEVTGSVWVYDLEGREIHRLLSNETLGNSAIVQWDGRNEEGSVADMGIYILFVQLWSPDGEVREYQETCALVKR